MSVASEASLLAAVLAEGEACRRQQARVRYHLRRRALRLRWQDNLGWLAVCPYSAAGMFHTRDLDEMEAWAREGRRR